MKKYVLLCALLLCVYCMTDSASGIEYCKDFLESGNGGGSSGSLKTFDEEWSVNLGATVDVDIWINDVPEKLLTAGFFVDYDASRLSLVSCDVYDGSLPGPWDSGMTIEAENPSGPGTYMAIVGNLGTVPADAGGDIPIARVTFESTSPGDAAVTFKPVPGFDTIVGAGNGSTVYDDTINPNTVTISQGQGTSTTTSSPTDSTTTTTASSADKDDDGISDGQDNCPVIPNGPDGGTCIWGTKIGEPCSVAGYDPMECGTGDPFCSMDQEDTDEDEVGNACDNCSSHENPGQEDTDCDGIGDACDGTSKCTQGVNCDADCDGVYNQNDNCPEKPNGPKAGTCTEGAVGEPCLNNEACGTDDLCSRNQEDKDGDGKGDACDPIEITTSTTTSLITTTSTTTTSVPSVAVVSPDSVCRLFWLPVPYLFSIEGRGTTFPFGCRIEYEPSRAVLHLPPLRVDEFYLWDLVLVMSGFSRGLINETETITVKTTCGDETTEGTFDIGSCLPIE